MGSLGAGLSLAVAASVLLLVVSTVVAFRGWPDDLGPSAESFSRLAPAAEADTQVRAAPLALPAVTVTRDVRPGGSRPIAGSPGDSAGPVGSALPGTAASPTPGSTPAASGGGRPGGQVDQTVQDTSSATGDAVRGVTKQAADAVRPAAPAAGGAVEDVGSTAGDVLDHGGNAVADALGALGH